MSEIFSPANILLPAADVEPEAWSVIACDQFSSEREYWERVSGKVGEKPSTLNMIIPEAYLEQVDEAKEIRKISGFMNEYVKKGVLREVEDSFIYVERTLADGRVRKGLVGAVDLEEYDFSGGDAAVLASEGTALDRLPPRIRVRREALLELPHIMTFIADKEASVIEPLAAKAGSLPLLYDFELMEGGGRLKGMRVCGGDAREVMAALNALHEKSGSLDMRNGASSHLATRRCLMIMGDGNHSLAAAKTYWDELKQSLSAGERENHPARRALLEVNNVYDDAISFEAIHRVIFDIDADDFAAAFAKAIKAGDDYALRLIRAGSETTVNASAGCIGDIIGKVQSFLDDYLSKKGGRIDYIHGSETAAKIAEENGCAAIILPSMNKSDFFDTVSARGIFPRKAFSVGHARDKRYYMECRRITMHNA